MNFVTQQIINGHKNAVIIVKGWADQATDTPFPILSLDDLVSAGEKPAGLKIESLVWTIQEKMGMNLWWEPEETIENFILPLESRNTLRLDHGLLSPKVPNWSGKIYANTFHIPERMHFMIVFDLDKQS